MNNAIENLVICDAVRTPFGHGNGMKSYRPEKLLEIVLRSLVSRNDLDVNEISAVIAGSVNQGTRTLNIARIASLMAGLPEKLCDYSVQANCNSGFTALITAMSEIITGNGELFLVAGVECMSRYGFRLEEKIQRFSSATEVSDSIIDNYNIFFDTFDIIDCLTEGLTDLEHDLSMIEIGEIMANVFAINREMQDQYTLTSLKRAIDAIEKRKIADHIVPLGDVKRDSYPLKRKRLFIKPESIKRSFCLFGEDNPVWSSDKFFKKHKDYLEGRGVNHFVPSVTMHNSCIPGDGASGCIITTEKMAKRLGLQPRLRVISWAKAGCDPVIMGIAPCESTERLFNNPMTERAQGIEMNDVDVIEIHEAFASQVLSVFKESQRKYGRVWNLDKVNLYGGSLAYTHPLGATNFRLLTNILSGFEENSSCRYAMASSCAGGGLGVSLLFERYE